MHDSFCVDSMWESHSEYVVRSLLRDIPKEGLVFFFCYIGGRPKLTWLNLNPISYPPSPLRLIPSFEGSILKMIPWNQLYIYTDMCVYIHIVIIVIICTHKIHSHFQWLCNFTQIGSWKWCFSSVFILLALWSLAANPWLGISRASL